MYWFLSGFTAKLAGTEIGVTEPQPTFSACFGAPFLPQPPSVYARMLGEKLDAHPDVEGVARQHGLDGRAVRRGPADADHGDARRSSTPRSRASSTRVEYRVDPTFGLEVPVEVPGVDSRAPRSRARRGPIPAAYDAKAAELAAMFRANFTRFDGVEPGVAAAGPR